MDWTPFLLTVASCAFLIPMFLAFQKQMGGLVQRRRAGEKQIQEAEASIQKFQEEEGKFKQEIASAKAQLSELDKERETLEKKLLAAKVDHTGASDQGAEKQAG